MPHILLIEDNPGDARLIAELLRESDDFSDQYQITHVERIGDAITLLHDNNTVDIIISDITLPDSSGLQSFTSLSAAASQLPVVFMTGTNDETFAVEAIHLGAQDYLVKGRITSSSLSKVITYAIERKKTQLEMSRMLAAAHENEQRLTLLAQQKRQLLNLNKAKDEFISLASHQLRTPATAVKQYIGMIIEGYVGDVDAKQLPMLQTAYDSNERQLQIINELLKTAQLDSNRYHLNLKPEILEKIVSEVIFEQKPMLKLRRQQIVYQPTAQHVACIDATEFKLVVTNLIENASKYTPAGKSINVMVDKIPRKFTVTVIDQGVGIAKDDQKRIFEKFTRVDNELSDTVTGSGLGLYWVRKIMRLHKGAIEVSSELGQGSAFTLSLPQ